MPLPLVEGFLGFGGAEWMPFDGRLTATVGAMHARHAALARAALGDIP